MGINFDVNKALDRFWNSLKSNKEEKYTFRQYFLKIHAEDCSEETKQDILSRINEREVNGRECIVDYRKKHVIVKKLL